MRVRPYLTLRARSLSSLLLCCEHASARLPRGIVAGAGTRALLATHRGWDIGSWDVVRELSRRAGATAIGGRYTRLWVDLNRPPGDPTLALERIDGSEIAFNAGLTQGERARRVRLYHAPYHRAIDRQLARRRAAGVRACLLSVHSFTPLLGRASRRFDAGVLFADHRPLALRLAASLRGAGLSVRLNQPYSGLKGLIYSAARHGGRHGVPYLELEINQVLLRSPAGRSTIGRRIARALSATALW